MEQGQSFKATYASLGLTADDVANFLQVTPRTVHLWISGRVRIPYAAYKLMRLQLRYELPGEAWHGWHLSAGRLYTPEGFELNPVEFTWWSLLVRQARMFRVLYRENNQLRRDMVAGRTAPGTAATARSGARPEPVKSGPTDAVGRPAQPAVPNLLLEHLRQKSTGKSDSHWENRHVV